MKTTSMNTIGCDIGDKTSELCVLDPKGKVIERQTIKTDINSFKEAFKRKKALVIIEVSTHSPWISILLKAAGHDVVVANTRNVHLITKGNTKNDVNDAEMLARLGRADVNLLSPIQHRSEEVRRDAVLLTTRGHLVETRTRMISVVRGIAKPFGTRIPLKGDTASFAKRARLHLPAELLAQVSALVELIEKLSEQIAATDKRIEKKLLARYPAAQRLMAVNGVGPITSLTFVLTLEDPTKFRHSRDVGAYLGLQPRQQSSGSRTPELNITKAGDRELRRLLVLCGHYILGPFGKDSDLRRFGLAIAARGGKNAKKRAVVAVARKLAVLLHALWKNEDVYQPLRNNPAAAA